MSKTKLLVELRKEFSKQRNPEIAKEQQRYMKSKMPFYGLQAPQLKKIYPPLFKKYAPTSNHEYRDTILHIFKNTKFDECYHLAAQSFVGHAIEDSTLTLDTNIKGTLNLLSVLSKVNNKCKFYYAGSSEMFGNCEFSPQNETTPFNPRTIYGISKVAGYEIMKLISEYLDVLFLYNQIFL